MTYSITLVLLFLIHYSLERNEKDRIHNTCTHRHHYEPISESGITITKEFDWLNQLWREMYPIRFLNEVVSM